MTRPGLQVRGETPSALRRVSFGYGPADQAAPALITVDYTAGKNTARVMFRPGLTAEEESSYLLRAAVMAALEPLRKYRRTVTRAFGVRAQHEGVFTAGYEMALRELEGLLRSVTLTGPDVNWQGEEVPQPLTLPDEFPFVAWLRADGIATLEDLGAATDAAVSASVGPDRLLEVRTAQEGLNRVRLSAETAGTFEFIGLAHSHAAGEAVAQNAQGNGQQQPSALAGAEAEATPPQPPRGRGARRSRVE